MGLLQPPEQDGAHPLKVLSLLREMPTSAIVCQGGTSPSVYPGGLTLSTSPPAQMVPSSRQRCVQEKVHPLQDLCVFSEGPKKQSAVAFRVAVLQSFFFFNAVALATGFFICCIFGQLAPSFLAANWPRII